MSKNSVFHLVDINTADLPVGAHAEVAAALSIDVERVVVRMDVLGEYVSRLSVATIDPSTTTRNVHPRDVGAHLVTPPGKDINDKLSR